MSVTTYKLVLVGPFPGITNNSTEDANAAITTWLNLNDDNSIADLTLPWNDDDQVDDDDSPAERARLLLEELEKEGQNLEEALQDTCLPSEGLGVFSDLTSIPPVADTDEAGDAALVPASFVNAFGTSADTEALLRDLEAMLPEVTPPQSPPHYDQHTVLADIDELLFQSSLSLPDPEIQLNYLPPTPSSSHSNCSPVPSPSTCSQMLSPLHAPSTPMSQPSPRYAPSTPASSPYPASTTSWDSDSTSDPDWVVEDAPGPSRERVTKRIRAKPYSRTSGRTKKPEERKERKKLQNKNAATRYRMKKREEEDKLLSEENELVEKNDELKGKVNDLANEIRIIKGLLRDQCKRLGILKDGK